MGVYMKKSICLVFFLAVTLMVAVPAPAAPTRDALTGHWEGAINLPGMNLEIRIDLDRDPAGSWRGDISIPLQKAVDLPLIEFKVEESSVQFAIEGVPGNPVFSGTLNESGTELAGTFTQGGQKFDFKLKKAQDPLAKARAALKGFSDLINKSLKTLNVPGVAVAIVLKDQVVMAEGFGLRDLGNRLPMTADTLLAIGSSSKAFTTFALGTLVDGGVMDWDKPVRTYIPWFALHDPIDGGRITPRDLVTHRSGLPRHDLVWYNNFSASREAFVRSLAYLKPSAGLRERWQYNNLMYLTAGYLLEVLTGNSWEQAITDLVFKPLNMKRSNFSVADSQTEEDFAQPYKEKDDKLIKIPFRNISNIGPAGAINSSVNEMSNWLMVQLYNGEFQGTRIINPATLNDMHHAHMPTPNRSTDARISATDYGMGWFIDYYRGVKRVHHGGNIDGFSCMVSLVPDKGLGFVVLANKNAAALPELLVRTALDRLLGMDEVDWIGDVARKRELNKGVAKKAAQKKQQRRVRDTRPSHALSAYAGTYHHPGYGDLQVEKSGKALKFTFNNIETGLEHWHYDTFNGRVIKDPTFEDMKFTFLIDENGYITSVKANFEPAVDSIEFEKQPDKKYMDAAFLQKFVADYDLAGERAVMSLKGNTLFIHLPGQPPYELVAGLHDEFYLKRMKIVRMKFVIEKSGEVCGIEIYQPQGVFTADRIKE